MPWKSLTSAGGQHKGPRSRQRPVFFSIYLFAPVWSLWNLALFFSDKHTHTFLLWIISGLEEKTWCIYIYIVFPSPHEKFQGFIHNQVLLERLRDLGFGALAALKLWDVFVFFFGRFLLKIRCPNCKKTGKVTKKPGNNVWRTLWDWDGLRSLWDDFFPRLTGWFIQGWVGSFFCWPVSGSLEEYQSKHEGEGATILNNDGK